MGTNYHTGYSNVAPKTAFTKAAMGAPLSELDRALTYLKVLVGCDGNISWNGTTLTWTDSIHIYFTSAAGNAVHNEIAAGSLAITDSFYAYVTLSETNNAVLTMAQAAISAGSASTMFTYNRLILGYRNADDDEFYPAALKSAMTAKNPMIYKGVLDCAANPNYPAANAGYVYIISAAGKVGGASGTDVEVSDMLICNTDNTAAGDEATVGAYWDIVQGNFDLTDYTTLTTFNDHSARHESGGDDAIKLDDLAAPDDNDTLDASTTAHGLAPKATAPDAGLRNVMAIDNAETAYTNKALFDATSPSTQAFGDSATVGTEMAAARRDHKHAMPAVASGAEINAVTDNAKAVTAKAIGDSTVKMWRIIPAANYTATPASTSTITMGVDMTASIPVGSSLRYTISSVEYFGIVTAIAAGLLTIAGAPLGGDVSNLQYGGGTVSQLGYNNADSVEELSTGTAFTFRWNKGASYLVYYEAKQIVHDTGTHGKITFKVAGSEVNTSAGGLEIAADDTWYKTVVDIDSANYSIAYQEDITIVVTEGSNADGYGLVANAIIITP